MAQISHFVKSNHMASPNESKKVEVIKLDAPTGLSYVEATENTITVSWNPVKSINPMNHLDS